LFNSVGDHFAYLKDSKKMYRIPFRKQVFNAVKSAYTWLPKLIPGYIGQRFATESAEKLIPIDSINTKYGEIKYYCLGTIPLWRSKTLYDKEPELIEWIDKMDDDDILWDVGANVGIYSIYAGKKGLKVFAFEPSALNTFFISKNIELNKLKENVFLIPLAVSDVNEFGYLNMSSTDVGGALNEFNAKDLKSVGEGNYKKDVIFKQGMFSYSTDELIEKYGFEIPNYIKIDVDSIEDRIIYGADKTLSSPKVKGVYLELDETEDRTQKMIDFLAERGLILIDKRHNAIYDDSDFATLYNYIFAR
jgi:FkbM family methyltransferase